MLELFVERLKIVEKIAKHKKQHNMPVLDQGREDEIIATGVSMIDDVNYIEYYREFIALQIKISKELQNKVIK